MFAYVPGEVINCMDCRTESETSFVVVVSGKIQQIAKYEESRVWSRQSPNKPWLNVHLHRSAVTAATGTA